MVNRHTGGLEIFLVDWARTVYVNRHTGGLESALGGGYMRGGC